MDKTTTSVHGPGLMGGLTSLAKNVLGLVVSRLELVALELSEVRKHVMALLTGFALAVICSWFAIAFGSAVIVALAWDAMGWKILLVMFIAFLVLTAGLAFKGLAMLKEDKLAFPETMNELKNDRDMLL